MRPSRYSRSVCACLAALSSLMASSSHAQSLFLGQTDFNRARTDAALGTSFASVNLPTLGSITSFSTYPSTEVVSDVNHGPPHAPAFNFNFIAPLDLTGGNGTQNVFEATPEAKLGFIARPGSLPLQVSAFIDESSNRYSGSAENYDQLDGSLRLDWPGSGEDSVRQRWIPYIAYSPQQIYLPFFSTSFFRTQDIAVGVNKLWDFASNWARFGPLVDRPAWELGLQAAAQRRIANLGADSIAILIAPSVKWSSTQSAGWLHCLPEQCGELAASLGINLTHRWYGAINATSRQLEVSPILTIAWVLPERFFQHDAARYGRPEIDFQLAYDRQHFNDGTPYNNFTSHQWALGPSVKAGWNF